jgi:hypothetical protein
MATLILHREWKEFLACLNASGVEYLIVGAVAVAHHARPRLTNDLDIWVRPSLENGQRIEQALKAFDFASLGFVAADFADPDSIVQLGVPPLRIDLITSISGIDSFDEAWNDRSPGLLGNVPTNFIGREALLVNKKKVARGRDLGDIEALRGLDPDDSVES